MQFLLVNNQKKSKKKSAIVDSVTFIARACLISRLAPTRDWLLISVPINVKEKKITGLDGGHRVGSPLWRSLVLSNASYDRDS